ncbi:MAG: hypothetical protein JXB30_06120 [Anaerolineae bacterium]|nr:hypothetical protein [Anaerolineae bacterium]
MSESPTIMILETAIDTYAQRLRAAKALQTGIGGSAKTLTKLGQAFEAYTEQNAALDPEVVHHARQVIERANFKENIAEALTPDLRREVRTLSKILKALKDALAAINSEPPDAVKLHKACTTLQSPDITDEEIVGLLPTLETELQQAQEQLGAVFGVALREQLAEWDIALGGRPPRFEAGRFEILADFGSRKAAIVYGKMEVARNIPLSIERTIKAYLAEVKSIQEREEDGQLWIQQFYQAWSMANLKRQRNNGRVSINECYYEMVLLRQKRTFNTTPSKNTFSDYSPAQFAYDFDRFVYSERQDYEGWVVVPHIATKSQAESASKSMWIVTGDSPHDGDYISGIEFEQRSS